MMILAVPFAQKDQAKALGAKWHPQKRFWYVPDGLDTEPFAHWFPSDALNLTQPIQPLPSSGSLQSSKSLCSDAQVSSVPVIDFLSSGLDLSMDGVVATEAACTSEQPSERVGLSLSHALSQVEQAVQQAFVSAVWVRCEIAQLNHRRHYYLELVESDDKGQEVAKCRAIGWQGTFEGLLDKFKQHTGSSLAVGMKVMWLCQPHFHPQYGFSFRLLDIDPAYTLGNLEMAIAQLRSQLQAQDLYERNRRLPMPFDYVHVAVLSPQDAAGLGDFQADAQRLERYGLVRFEYFHARFQGDLTATQFQQQAVHIEQRHTQEPFDALVIIRGGGSRLDLHHLNQMVILTTIAQLPMPVFTGIGHEQDTTLLDEIAHAAFDTPSKVIGAIWQHIQHRAQQLVHFMDGIRQQTTHTLLQQQRSLQNLQVQLHQIGQRQLMQHKHILHQCQQRVDVVARQQWQQHRRLLQMWPQWRNQLPWHLGHHRQALWQMTGALKQGHWLVRQRLKRNRTLLSQLQQQLFVGVQHYLNDQRQDLLQAKRVLDVVQPQHVLKRGYGVLTTADGQVLKDGKQLRRHLRQTDRIQVQLQDGRVLLQVTLLDTMG